MAGQTKMIIITSDEDIIRQFSSNKNKNTQIIDLDDDQKVTSIIKDNNDRVSSALLAELSELHSNNDQIYKRVLSSPDHPRPKSAKVSKKSMDLICTICGDRAIGFNYDVLSCASCKAFFRRNANQPPEKIRCLTGRRECSVAHDTYRKCPRCRLDRCLSVGMRKDFIQSSEVKLNKKKRLEENRINTSKRLSISESIDSSHHSSNPESIDSSHHSSNSESASQILEDFDSFLTNMDENNGNIVFHESNDINYMEDILFETLTVEEWLTIQSIQLSFASNFQSAYPKFTQIDLTDRSSALICWSQAVNGNILSCINFFRQMDEFENLHEDDRFTLIKFNLFPLFPIYKCFYFKPINDYCFREDARLIELRQKLFTSSAEADYVHNASKNLLLSLCTATKQDPTVLSLLMAALIFSQGLSLNEAEPSLLDPLAAYRAQAFYTQLLWKYLVNKSGEEQAIKNFVQLLNIVFKMQSVARVFRDFFRAELQATDTVDQLAPLMKTVLHIS